MKDVTGIFWPQSKTHVGAPGAAPPEFDTLLAELAAITGVKIVPAADHLGDDIAADQTCLVIHLAYLEGTILSYEAAVAEGHEDTLAGFSAFASAAFDPFLTFRRRWLASAGTAGDVPRLNISRVRIDPEGEARALLMALPAKKLRRKSPSASDIKRIVAACQPLLELTAPGAFRHHDHKTFAMLRQIKLPRTAVVKTFQDLMQRTPSDDQTLFFQAMPSLERLRDALMTSQEYLNRFGMSEDEIRTGYEMFLNRTPSAREIEQVKKTHPNLASLRKVFIKSPEFARQFAQTAGAGNSVMTGMAGGEVNKPVPLKSAPNLQPSNADRVVFLHIPKCGGTTLHNMLQQWFSPENVHPERFNGLYGYTGASLASSLVFSGHYDYYSTTLIPGPRKLISFLRDPLDRLVSLYNFHRAHSPAIIERNNLQLPRWANENDIDAYFAHPTIRGHPAINNSIVRYFSDIPQIARSHRSDEMDNITLDDMLEQALTNLKKFAFVGFMDQYDADMDRLADTLQRDRPAEVRKHQVLDELMTSNPDMRKIKKQKPNAASREAMEELVSYDRIFYAQARELFT